MNSMLEQSKGVQISIVSAVDEHPFDLQLWLQGLNSRWAALV